MFVSSQLVSKVLVSRVRPKALMMSGIGMTIVALLMSSQLHAGASFPQILVGLVLLGLGSGTALVPLTTAGLAGVEPADAGAASGLVNVTQQVGAALGLAVLVTVLGRPPVTPSCRRVRRAAASVHGLDVTFGVAALFGIAALVMVGFLVHLPGAEPVGADDADDRGGCRPGRGGAGAGAGRR